MTILGTVFALAYRKMVFPVVIYGCESWTIKKAEHWRTDAFELWCWRRLLRVAWTARRSNQSIQKEINPEYSLEGLMLKLKLQYLGSISDTPKPDVKGQLIRKAPDAGKDWRQEEKGKTEEEMVGWQHWLNWHEFEQALEDGEGQGSLVCCSSWGHKESDTTKWLNNNRRMIIVFIKVIRWVFILNIENYHWAYHLHEKTSKRISRYPSKEPFTQNAWRMGLLWV